MGCAVPSPASQQATSTLARKQAKQKPFPASLHTPIRAVSQRSGAACDAAAQKGGWPQ